MAKIIKTVDDSASIRQMVSFTLKGAGYDVVEATDGRDAYPRQRQPHPHGNHGPQYAHLDGIGLIGELREKTCLQIYPDHYAHHGVAGI